LTVLATSFTANFNAQAMPSKKRAVALLLTLLAMSNHFESPVVKAEIIDPEISEELEFYRHNLTDPNNRQVCVDHKKSYEVFPIVNGPVYVWNGALSPAFIDHSLKVVQEILTKNPKVLDMSAETVDLREREQINIQELTWRTHQETIGSPQLYDIFNSYINATQAIAEYLTGEEMSLYWLFLRRYTPTSRKGLGLHVDGEKGRVMSFNLMLSDPDHDFAGGRLVYVPEENDEAIAMLKNRKWFEKFAPQLGTFNQAIHPNTFSPRVKKGTVVINKGTAVHGVEDVSDQLDDIKRLDERYTLQAFFASTRELRKIEADHQRKLSKEDAKRKKEAKKKRRTEEQKNRRTEGKIKTLMIKIGV
jgi:hypothetical protein